MVVYDLLCKENHQFEGWFPNFESYQEQLARKQIACPTCGTTKVEKIPHACAVISKRGEKEESSPAEKSPVPLTEAEARELLIKLHHHVTQNFEDVGPRFAQEARAIFYGHADPKPIHGTSTPKEQEELDEEGVPYLVLPKPKLDG
jgi:hypothetical protein